MEFLPIKRALLSVTDKTGLVEFAGYLQDNGVELVSTGGTRKKMLDAGLNVISVSDVTGFPEMLNGRVKTLHPNIHAGVLADKDNPEHLTTLESFNLRPFDLVCVNLYNFAQAKANKLPLKQAIEQIDVGGPTMLRAAAKNFHGMLVAPGPETYDVIKADLDANDFAASLKLRKDMATKTFALTAEYDAMITDYLSSTDA
ncbi:IMP cyclohydrolase [Desulfovibrio inopinatus]|uniref:IMP cyclohydrolase n=1 Tax=Desulfovibrio inopinatus TaxID=102109 RepID=UPI000406739B|nr:IMP cyclohydrolase [Desulfovibrio inopinatus]